MNTKIAPDWIAVDWGTSRLRVWLMSAAGAVLARYEDPRGMGQLQPADFEPVLLDLIADCLPPGGRLPVICCGMAGARQGWVEAPYIAVPSAPGGLTRATRPATQEMRLDVRILPGLKQASPADVLRGEETQIAGFLSTEPRFDGVICLPGTHSKWVHVSADEVVSFRTFMTGELFSLLATQSVLRHSVAMDGWDDDVFVRSVSDALARPANVAADLFGIRAEALLADLPPHVARARLSGLLIGAELAGARPYWLGRDIVIVGDPRLAKAYEAALAAQGVPVRFFDGDTMTLCGLTKAWAEMKEPTA